MITDLKDPDASVRFYAAQDLGYLEGPEMARAVDPLIAAVRDANSGVHVAALRALGQIADPGSVDAASVSTLHSLSLSFGA